MENMFREAIKHEQERISRLIDLTDENWEPNEQGILLLQGKGSKQYCYEKFCRQGQKQGKRYLGKPDSEAAREYVRKKYLKEKHSRMVTDRALLDELLEQYQDYDFQTVMAALPDSYRKVTFEDFNDVRYEEIKRWAAADYPVNQAPFPDKGIYTQNGLRVRSKGECIHANIYDSMGIPYRYDCMLVFKNEYGEARTLSPDFLILCFNNTLIIIEHLGRLFDKGYSITFGEKCYWYLQQGFVLGKNFFVTSDDINGGTDSNAIMKVAKAVERLFYGF